MVIFVSCRYGSSQSRSKSMYAPSWTGNALWLFIFGICFHQQPPFPGHSACMKKHFRYMCPVEPSKSPGKYCREKTIKSHFIIVFLNCFFESIIKLKWTQEIQWEIFSLSSALWTGLFLNFSRCLLLFCLIWWISTADFLIAVFLPPNQRVFLHS